MAISHHETCHSSSSCLLVLREQDALFWAIRSTPKIPGGFFRASAFSFWPADLWHPWPTFNRPVKVKKTNLLSAGFNLPSRKLNSPPSIFRVYKPRQLTIRYVRSSHQNSHWTSPSLGDKMWEDHDPRGHGCRREEAFSLKSFIKWITWMSLTVLWASQGSKNWKLQSWKSNFCLSPWETFSLKWLLNQHCEHPYCATLYPLSELRYRIEDVQTHRSAALKCWLIEQFHRIR